LGDLPIAELPERDEVTGGVLGRRQAAFLTAFLHPELLAFLHPKPSYPVHILLMPKLDIPNFQALDADNPAFMADLIKTAQSLVEEFGLAEKGYRLIVNGGEYQDFPHLHFHLISDM